MRIFSNSICKIHFYFYVLVIYTYYYCLNGSTSRRTRSLLESRVDNYVNRAIIYREAALHAGFIEADSRNASGALLLAASFLRNVARKYRLGARRYHKSGVYPWVVGTALVVSQNQ